MSVDRYTLDTNILFYAVDLDAGSKHTLASNLIVESTTKDCILTLQSLGEFFWAVTRKGKIPTQTAQDQIIDWSTLFPIQSAGSGTLIKAMRGVQQHGLSFWDAMLWACSKEAGCSRVLTEDFNHGQVIEGVLFENPFISFVGE